MKKDIKKLKHQFRKHLFSAKISIEESRQVYDDFFYSPYIPNNVDIEEKKFKYTKVDILKPEITAYGRNILYVHGGFFVAGSRRSYRNLCSSIAHSSKANLYLPEYRLAPEYPFPTALEDLYGVYASMIQSEKVQTENLTLIGDGAGAALILSLIKYLHKHDLPVPALLVLISPWVDLSCSSEDLKINRKKDFMFSRETLLNVAKLYTYENNLKNNLVSPIFMDFKEFPKTIIQCGGSEILLADTKELTKKLKEANTECDLKIYENMPHLFQALPDYFAEAHIAVEKIGQDIDSFFA